MENITSLFTNIHVCMYIPHPQLSNSTRLSPGAHYMPVTKNKNLLFLLLLLPLAGCTGKAGEADAAAAFPPPAVAVMEVVPHAVPVEREYVGQTMGSREVEIHARVTGIVEARLYEEGETVEAGAPLFRIDPK